MMRQLPSGRLSAIALPTSLLLLGAVFRLGGLARDQRFHPDEALYADLSRRMGIWGDWQLSHIPVDKPPLFFMVGGFFQRVLGDSEFAVRLPNAFASLVTLALIYVFVSHLTGKKQAGLLAMLLIALSPMDIAFAISGFTDPQMVTWLMASLVLLLHHRWGWSGLLFGLAIAIKPAALWFLSLIAVMAMGTFTPQAGWRWLGGVLLVLGLITLWDQVSTVGSVWQLGQQNYDGGRLIYADEVIPRLETWLKWLGYFFPHPFMGVGGIALVIFYGLQSARKSDHPDFISWSMAGFILVYLVIHWLVAFNLYDRYLLPLLPLAAILTGIAICHICPHWIRMVIVGLILLVGIPSAWNAVQGKSPVASDAGEHSGIDTLAEVMNRDFAGEIFYEHWLGWELRYYLTADPQVILLYFPTPDDLAEYALHELPTIPVPRYFVAPIDQATPWVSRLRRAGITVEAAYQDGRFVIYRLYIISGSIP